MKPWIYGYIKSSTIKILISCDPIKFQPADILNLIQIIAFKMHLINIFNYNLFRANLSNVEGNINFKLKEYLTTGDVNKMCLL